MAWELTRDVSPSVTEVDHTGSTNADLLAGAADAAHLTVLLTRDQRSGRGRLDRQWTAPPGSALAVSVVVQVPGIPAEARGWVPLIAGSAMCHAVAEQLAGFEVGLKWPNDVLVAEDGELKKIVGVLAEVAARDTIVIGTGVNTAMERELLPVATATSFAALGDVCNEDRLVASFLGALDRLLTALADADGDAAASGVLDEVSSSCLTLGREVRVELPGGGELLGRATHLDSDGRLVVAGTPVAAGDVIHVR
ncbi:MAG: biotin--[acetyl-CoA-carboxylase] ligase [Microbacterium sp.]